jgi:sigma-B regulation protein RsbU (phosphoserine phosphatase)
MKILVVDDDTMPRKSLARAMRRWGHTVLEASDGDEAWDLCCDHEPDIVLTDWLMPRVDGVELCRRIRSAMTKEFTYVILLTSQTQPEKLVEALRAGADEFLSKPVSQEELKARLGAGKRIVGLQRRLNSSLMRIRDLHQRLTTANQELRTGLEQWLKPEQPSESAEGTAPLPPEVNRVMTMVARWLKLVENYDFDPQQFEDVSHGESSDDVLRTLDGQTDSFDASIKEL